MRVEPFARLLIEMEKLPSASIKPAAQALLKIGDLSRGRIIISCFDPAR